MASRATPNRHAVRVRLVFTATLAALLLAGCHSGPSATAAAPAPMLQRHGEQLTVPANSPLRARLQVAPAAAAAGDHTLTLPAVVEADPAHSVNIVPPLAGRLLELKVHLGDAVRSGQPLAVIGAPDLGQASADAIKARDSLELARHALQRARGVNAAGANAGKDMEQAESAYNQANAEAVRAEQRLHALGADGGHALVLRAPQAGTVTAINSGTGAWLGDSSATLISIANLDPVWLVVQVPENQIAAVAKGQQADATLAAWPQQAWHGAIASVSPVLDPDTRRARARIALANADGKLKPNMYASVTLAVPQAAQPSVPASALLMNNDSTTVMVEVAPWTFQRRAVTTGAEDGEQVRILSGLKAGERIVVRGGVLLND